VRDTAAKRSESIGCDEEREGQGGLHRTRPIWTGFAGGSAQGALSDARSIALADERCAIGASQAPSVEMRDEAASFMLDSKRLA